MSKDEVQHIEERLDKIAKEQSKQSSNIDRLCRVILNDDEAGTKGLGQKFNELEERVSSIEKFKSKITWVSTIFVTVVTAAWNFILYYGKEIVGYFQK